MSARNRTHRFISILLERGEWDQREAEAIHEMTKPKDDVWVDNNFLCVACKEPMTKGFINYNYMLENAVWAETGFLPNQLAHIACVEKKLGRALVQDDFTNVPMNQLIHWLFDNGHNIPKN